MGASDSGSWKLIIYPIIIVVAIGLLFSLILQPFISAGVTPDISASPTAQTIVNLIQYGVPQNSTTGIFGIFGIFNPLTLFFSPISLVVPQGVKDFMITQVYTFYYMPSWIQVPILVILSISIGYGLYVAFTMLIP